MKDTKRENIFNFNYKSNLRFNCDMFLKKVVDFGVPFVHEGHNLWGGVLVQPNRSIINFPLVLNKEEITLPEC